MTDRQIDQYITDAMDQAEIPEEVKNRLDKVTAAVRLSARTDPERMQDDDTIHSEMAVAADIPSASAYDEENETNSSSDYALPPRRHTGRSRKSFRRWRVALIAAALTVCAGFTVFAASAIYRFRIDQQAEHQVEVTLTDEGESSGGVSADPVEALTEVPEVKMKVGYLPKGLTDNSAEKGTTSYLQEDGNGGYFIGNPIILDISAASWTADFVTDYETLSVGGRDAAYVARRFGTDPDWVWKDLYITFPEVNRIVDLTAWGYAPKEELIKIGEGITLEKGDGMIPVSGQATWSQILANMAAQAEDAANVIQPEEKMTATADEMKNLHQLGESFTVDTFQFAGGRCPVSVKALEFQTADDFSVLKDKDRIPVEWTALLTADGKLGTAVRKYYTAGDGINTFPELVREEEAGLKLVEVTLEYTNDSDQDLKDVFFYGCLLSLMEENGEYRVLTTDLQEADFVEYDWYLDGTEMQYYDVTGGERNNNYIPSLKAGESQIVHVAWILFEDEADHLYLALDGSGHSFTEDMLKTGLIQLPGKTE